MARPPTTSPGGARKPPTGPKLSGLLAPYRWQILLLVGLTVASSAVGLFVPQVIAHAIDGFTAGRLDMTSTLSWLLTLTAAAFVLGSLQVAVQIVASERVARDLRTRLAGVIAQQTYASVEALTPARLLTNLTSDVDAIKTFISQAVASLISSFFLIIGTSALLLWLNWQLALAVLAVLPLIAVTFSVVLGRVRKLFGQIQGMIDALNKVLNENIVGAALVRLLNTQGREFVRFVDLSGRTRAISLQILRQFATMMPFITFLTNVAILTILTLGGHFVIQGSMTLGQFTAFNAYLSILIFPIVIIGFMSQAIGQAQASYMRLARVLFAPSAPARGESAGPLSGAIEVRDLKLVYAGKSVLDHVSFKVAPGTRTAIIGPTAAGKSQLLLVMAGLLTPTSGEVLYDGRPIGEYSRAGLYSQIGFVFQDSALFNLSLRENIAFNTTVDDASLARAIETAELADFIATLPQGLDTVVSERGASLSGGQKQRVMLARALAIDPKILFLDDFTARVDAATEARILANVARNYPGLTLVSITQKIEPVQGYDQIILLMEGEVLATGSHEHLAGSSPEYVQILRSQETTDQYEAA
ncbi:MAG: ABC transporter ATP-binding protein [Alphaproteobacteria bacterium]